MHPGISSGVRRRHYETRASAGAQLVATSEGLVEAATATPPTLPPQQQQAAQMMSARNDHRRAGASPALGATTAAAGSVTARAAAVVDDRVASSSGGGVSHRLQRKPGSSPTKKSKRVAAPATASAMANPPSTEAVLSGHSSTTDRPEKPTSKPTRAASSVAAVVPAPPPPVPRGESEQQQQQQQQPQQQQQAIKGDLVVEQPPHRTETMRKKTTGPLLPPPSVEGSRSSAVVPASSTVPTLPPLEARRRGMQARLHAHGTAEEWIDGIVSKYGGLPAASPPGTLKGLGLDDPDAAELGSDPIRSPGGFSSDSQTGVSQPAIAGAAAGGGRLTTVQGARLRRQIFALCQQLQAEEISAATMVSRGTLLSPGTAGSLVPSSAAAVSARAVAAPPPPPIEVEVREGGHRVWHSAACSADEMCVDELDGAVEAVDDDAQQVRRRAQKAFQQTVKTFKARVEQLKQQLDRAQLDLKSREKGGTAFHAVAAELDAQRVVNRQLTSKIKALLKLLERAGATIRSKEDQYDQDDAGMGAQGNPSHHHHHHNHHGAVVVGGTGANGGLDWQSLLPLIPDLVVEEREGPGILRDVAEHVEKQNARLAELEASNEIFAEKFGDKDAECDGLRRERNSAVIKIRLLDSTVQSLRQELASAGQQYAALSTEAEAAKRLFGEEKEKLVKQMLEAELAIRKTVEVRSHFIGLGRSLGVPVFMRYEGRIRNLALAKKDLEDLINLIWAARDTCNAVKRAQRAIELHERQQQQRETEGSNPAPATGPSLGHGVQADQLIDYDNVRFVRKLNGPFAEHVAVFLVQHYLHITGITMQQAEESTREGDGETAEDDAATLQAAENSTSRPPTTDSRNAPRRSGGRDGAVAARARTAARITIPTKEEMRQYGFTLPTGVAELIYSLMDGCEKYKYDADVELFRRVARNDISELAYFDQMVMLAKLRAALHSASRSVSTPNSVSVNMIMDVAKRFFVTKSAEALADIRKALILELPDGETLSEIAVSTMRLSISKLFASNEHGNQGPFIEAVRDQHLDELCEHVSELSDCVAACSQAEEAHAGVVPLYVVRRRLHELDPTKPMDDVNRFLLHTLAHYNDEVDQDGGQLQSNAIHLNAEVECERLALASKRVFAKRYGPLPKSASTAITTEPKSGIVNAAPIRDLRSAGGDSEEVAAAPAAGNNTGDP